MADTIEPAVTQSEPESPDPPAAPVPGFDPAALPVPDPVVIRAYLQRRPTPCPRCGYNLEGSDGTVCPECAGVLSFRGNPIRCAERESNEERDMSVVALATGILFADLGAAGVVLGSFVGIVRGPAAIGGLAAVVVLTGLLVWLRLNTGWLLRQPAGWRVVLALLGWSWMIAPLVGWFVYFMIQAWAETR